MNFTSHTAVLGGSFSPPHVGHVQVVQDLLKNVKVKDVLVLPSYGTPLKSVEVSYSHRFEMAKAAFSELSSNAPVKISDLEGTEKYEYTWQVLNALNSMKVKTAFVIGTDQFENLEKWNRYPDVLGLSDWMVLVRKPHKLDELGGTIRKYMAHGWLIPTAQDKDFRIRTASGSTSLWFVETDAKEVSSSQIREKFALGKKEEAKALVPLPVYDYIERNRLYGT